MLSALDGLKQASDLKQDQLLLAGQSAGGDTVMYMSTLALPGLRGVLNFAGGRTNHTEDEILPFENKMMIDGWAELGRSAKVPALLVFAENDSRYSANTIRQASQVFRDAGGQAELLLLPPLKVDGHFVYQFPDLWTPAVQRFVARTGMGKPLGAELLASATTPASQASAKTHPELFDLNRLPTKWASCRALYYRFLYAPLPRYFAAGANGIGCGFSFGPGASADKALNFCKEFGNQCGAYAYDLSLGAEPPGAGVTVPLSGSAASSPKSSTPAPP